MRALSTAITDCQPATEISRPCNGLGCGDQLCPDRDHCQKQNRNPPPRAEIRASDVTGDVRALPGVVATCRPLPSRQRNSGSHGNGWLEEGKRQGTHALRASRVKPILLVLHLPCPRVKLPKVMSLVTTVSQRKRGLGAIDCPQRRRRTLVGSTAELATVTLLGYLSGPNRLMRWRFWHSAS